MGGMDASIPRAEVGVVLKAPVMSCRALFCAHSRVVLINEDFPSQNAMLPYVAIGSIVPRYICLRQSWLMLLIQFPSMQMASVAFEAFDAAIWVCSWNFRCRSNQSPRYLMQLDGVTSFCSPGLFGGMCMDGLLFRFLDFVKCISSFLTWSICSPLCKSHLCVSLNAIVFICVVEIRSGPDTRIAPSSTYSVIGESVMFSSLARELSSGDSSMHFLVLRCTSPIIGEVTYDASIGEMHKPCGTVVRIGWSSSLLPSRQMVVHQSCRKVCTHCTIGSGKCCEWSVSSRCEWGMVLKNPVMSNVRIEALRLWFHAISMSCTVQRRASSADLLGMPPNWDDGKRLCLAAMCDSRHACMHSRTLPSTSSSCMRWYECGNE